jgi:hypothetical protein
LPFLFVLLLAVEFAAPIAALRCPRVLLLWSVLECSELVFMVLGL